MTVLGGSVNLRGQCHLLEHEFGKVERKPKLLKRPAMMTEFDISHSTLARIKVFLPVTYQLQVYNVLLTTCAIKVEQHGLKLMAINGKSQYHTHFFSFSLVFPW